MLLAFAALSLLQGQANPQPVKIRQRYEHASSLAGIPPILVDSTLSTTNIASETARANNLQARVLWVDATANIDRYNTEDKIKDLMFKITDSGFNTVVVDVKPISGQTIYPSQFAPKLTEWRGKTLPPEFDPLAIFAREARLRGISLLVSMNAFSEGHNLLQVGPGFAKPEWQSVLYEPVPVVASPSGATYQISTPYNQLPADTGSLGWFTQASKLPAGKAGNFAVTLDRFGYVVDGFEDGGIAQGVPSIPPGGSVLVGSGGGAAFLRALATPGSKLALTTNESWVRTGERPERQFPLIMNPNHPAVQSYLLSIVREVVTKYDIDGILFDDRFRYAGLDADFSPITRAAFEEFVKRKVNWPDDIFKYTLLPNLQRGIQPGPLFDTWLAWRAKLLKSFLYRTRVMVKGLKPKAQVGLYVGSWYGDYPFLGANWASQGFEAGFWFLTPEYSDAGLSGLLDFLITGNYYTVGTTYEAMAMNQSMGATVEASASLVQRAVRDRTWVYSGLQMNLFRGNQDAIKSCLQAACSTSQGVMVFDLSHDVEKLWPLFKQAFVVPAKAPHLSPQLLNQVRTLRSRYEARKPKEPPVIMLNGTSGTGQ